MPMLTPEQRAGIARAKGAKSRGPKTGEGKAASSRNAIRTGEYAHQILDFIQPHFAVPGGWEALARDLAAVYRPAHLPAQSLVRDIAFARWQIDCLNACIALVWDHALPPTRASVECKVAAAVEIFGASAVVTRLGKEVARLQRQVAALERQLLLVHKHFAPPLPCEAAALLVTEPEMGQDVVAPEATMEAIMAYRRQYPHWRIVILPSGQITLDEPPARSRIPRRAA
ncbi:MAG TPA: hypothetical protein VFQ91_22580 [Bryobacteraceae bacterium]|nr:hypothetical protein [Bryobacteraceae bacterium]